MKTAYFSIFVVILFVAWFGFLFPYLVSAKSTELVIGSILGTLLVIPLGAKVVINFFKGKAK